MKTWICCLLTRDWPNDKNYAPGLGERYVKRLQMMAHRWAPDAEFVCFTDRKEIAGVQTRTISPIEGYCWEKLYLFAPWTFPAGDRVLYMDLDSTIYGDMAPLLSVDLTLPVFLDDRGPDNHWPNRRLGAGLFTFEVGPKYYHLWENFDREHADVTDELYLQKNLVDWRSWAEVAPRKVLSYKWDIARRKQLIGDARVIFFHCQPRPHTVNLPWNLHYETRNGGSPPGR